MLHKKEKVKKNLKRPSDENHQKISSVRRENKYIYMYIYTHFQTVAILKKIYMPFVFLYIIYIYIYIGSLQVDFCMEQYSIR